MALQQATFADREPGRRGPRAATPASTVAVVTSLHDQVADARGQPSMRPR